MSLFDNIINSFYLTEDNFDDNNQNQEDKPAPAEGNQDTGEEGGEGTDDEYSMNDPEADNDEGEENQNQENNDNQDTEDDEYSMNDPESDNDDGEGNQDTGEEGGEGTDDEYSMNDPEADNDEGEENQDTEPTDDPSAKLKDIEKSIFDQLTPEQQTAKTKELKNLYNDTYTKCQTIVDMVSMSEKEPSQAKVYDYIINNLVDLQKYIRDYLNDIFDSKTYIENMTELQKYLAILDTINNVFEEIKKGSETQAK